MDYYQYTATVAEALLARQAQTRPAPTPEILPAAIPDLPNRVRALSWARAERDNLLACLDYVTSSNQDTRYVALTASVAALLRHDGPWAEAITRHTMALQAARRLGDHLGQVNALYELGTAWRLAGDYSAATGALEETLSIARSISNRAGQVNALCELGTVWRLAGDYSAATAALEEALTIARSSLQHA